MTDVKKTLMSGMRPTGELHLGNYLGALENWVKLQNEYNCFFSIVDWHALTTAYKEVEQLDMRIFDMACDWLAAGLDPKQCAIFRQSDIKEIAELHLLFSMIIPLSWLERVPTYKDQLQQLKEKEINTYGFLGYPLLQACDILVCQGEVIPVGEDQVPHIELTREIGRRFNHLYNSEVFKDPIAKLTENKVLPGLDNRKMSKSYQNYIRLTASPDEIMQKVRSMVTDPERIRKDDPGNPEVCSVYAYHKIFNTDQAQEVATACKAGTIGCMQCKKILAEKLTLLIQPIYEKKQELVANPDYVKDVLNDGAKKTRAIALQSLEKVRELMGVR
ncbi:tryptophan--tRNA ligase [Desulfuribacillus stibiiarsenatis]|uniref:Tryptophan--tRNA ligase n=1 Tax=Desulfuribacillus stibiiarsenatis TaxID=1390249 RepID=A0A1E5L6T2_9FIRM|nr:tryptophan--tRNA ligase [Desulfuribacillus stibiiarsenatis]OEH85714.1 tryptophan--tRNA ligase [Desulfuribacillus stibiiarsenatis]